MYEKTLYRVICVYIPILYVYTFDIHTYIVIVYNLLSI